MPVTAARLCATSPPFVPHCDTSDSTNNRDDESSTSIFGECSTHGGAGSLQCNRVTRTRKYSVSARGHAGIGAGELPATAADSPRWSV